MTNQQKLISPIAYTLCKGNISKQASIKNYLLNDIETDRMLQLGGFPGNDCSMIEPDSELDPRYQSIVTTPDWYQTHIPCQVGCPAHTDVATYIGLISQARFDEAYLINRKCNVVPGVLGRTCARPCEPVCRRNKVDGKPIAICWLKRAAAD